MENGEWYVASPTMINECRGRLLRTWRDSLLRTRPNACKPYDPTGSLNGIPTRPNGNVRKNNYRRGVEWTEEKRNRIVELRDSGLTLTEIAREMGATRSVIQGQISYMLRRGMIRRLHERKQDKRDNCMV